MRVVLDTNVIMSGIFFAEPMPLPSGACDDEDDVKFLACAISGNATCVVSGDRALHRTSGYEGIEVVTPRIFVTRFLGD